MQRRYNTYSVAVAQNAARKMNDKKFQRRLEGLIEDRHSGASELARLGLEVAAQCAQSAGAKKTIELRHYLAECAKALAAARPSMSILKNLMEEWKESLEVLPDDVEEARVKAAETALNLAEQSTRASFEAAALTSALVGNNKTIITHSFSSTVLEVFHLLKNRGVQAIVPESRPLCEGADLAERLSQWDIPATYITDAQVGLFAAHADIAIVGADTLLADGSAINKAGTLLLAMAAHAEEVPFYVCCESFKLWPQKEPPALEEMSPAELGTSPWPGVSVSNIYFDVTPAHLITGWCTERGAPDPEIGDRE